MDSKLALKCNEVLAVYFNIQVPHHCIYYPAPGPPPAVPGSLASFTIRFWWPHGYLPGGKGGSKPDIAE